ncbi:hypothetical protein NQD34_016789 [Periophthalmus magnuspinnatus]|nr:hypothetical protein NQD34_016789 [Periophthalmus magnuspinnatus]
MERTEASEYCTKMGMRLVTVYDEDDVKFVVNLGNSNIGVWVGLYRTTCNSDTDADPPQCPATPNTMRDCSDELPFKCSQSSNETGVDLNWCAARQYCQYHSLGDLASSESESKDRLWILGEITDDWKWEDGGCSTYREWKENHSVNGNCGAAVTFDYKLKSHGDDNRIPPMCSKGDLRIVVVNKTRLTWEQALDYCDKKHSGLLQILTPEHQKSVELWLSNTGYTETFWVGLRQSRVFGFWIWKDTMVNSSNWANGEQPVMPLSHQCGVIQAPGYTWRDHNCLHPLPFICQEMIVRLNKD